MPWSRGWVFFCKNLYTSAKESQVYLKRILKFFVIIFFLYRVHIHPGTKGYFQQIELSYKSGSGNLDLVALTVVVTWFLMENSPLFCRLCIRVCTCSDRYLFLSNRKSNNCLHWAVGIGGKNVLFRKDTERASHIKGKNRQHKQRTTRRKTTCRK